MVDFLFPRIGGVELNARGVLVSVGIAFVLGLILSAVYLLTNRRRGYTSDFPAAVALLAPLMAAVIFLVNSSVAVAVSLGGALALLRIRSNPRDTMEITTLLFAIVIGIGCGTGYYGVSMVITVILCALTVILSVSGFGTPKAKRVTVKIYVPEDLNFEGVFDEVLEKYTEGFDLMQIKTADFGSVYELKYMASLKDGADRRALLDELRCKNGNLDVSITLRDYDSYPQK